MMKITVGIVSHGAPPRYLFDATGRVRSVAIVNANIEKRTPWRGFGANHNDLMKASDSDWYIALNPDVKIVSRDIERLVDEARDSDLVVAGPRYDTPWGEAGHPQNALPSPRVWLSELAGVRRRTGERHDGVAESAWVTGACLAINRARMPALMFDERYFMYFEDTELCRRAVMAGGRVGVVGNVEARHDSGWSASDALRKHRGVEFARSALLFAEQADIDRLAMRSAGLARFGSRALLGRSKQSRVAGRVIARGFLGAGPGIRELAESYNREFQL